MQAELQTWIIVSEMDYALYQTAILGIVAKCGGCYGGEPVGELDDQLVSESNPHGIKALKHIQFEAPESVVHEVSCLVPNVIIYSYDMTKEDGVGAPFTAAPKLAR